MKQLPVSLTPTETRLGFAVWGLQMLVLPVALQMLLSQLAPHWGEAQQNFVYHALSFLALTAVMLRFLRQSGKAALVRPFYTLRIAFYGYVLYWVGFLAVTWTLLQFAPGFANTNDGSIALLLQENYPLTAIIVLFLAPISEELVYRGLVFGTLHSRSRLAAYCISTAVFASIHVLGYLGSQDFLQLGLCFLQYIPAGLTLAWVYDRTGTIWAPIILHMTINQTSILSLR